MKENFCHNEITTTTKIKREISRARKKGQSNRKNLKIYKKKLLISLMRT